MTMRLPVLALTAALCSACAIVHSDGRTRCSGRPVSGAMPAQEHVLAPRGGPGVGVQGATCVEFTPEVVVRHAWRD